MPCATLLAATNLLIRDAWQEAPPRRHWVAGPTDILSDSQSAVGMAFDPISFKNTKHIMRAAEFLRDLVLKGHVILKHVPGTLMIADILTKAPARATFIELVKLLDDYSRTP